MATYPNATRILKNDEVRVASSAEGIYDENIVILYWQSFEARHIEECISYLNDDANSTVPSGTKFYDHETDDELYHIHAYYDHAMQRLYRLMYREPTQTSYYAQDATKWKLGYGETYQAGQSNVVLQMNNVDPAYAIDIQEEALAESYTDSIYMLGGDFLEGEWHSIKREAVLSARTGLYTVRWYLTRLLGNEFGFIYRDNYLAVRTEINLIETNNNVKDEFMDETIIDTDGNWYRRTGPEDNTADRKNGIDLTDPTVHIGPFAPFPDIEGYYELADGDGTLGDPTTKWTHYPNGTDDYNYIIPVGGAFKLYDNTDSLQDTSAAGIAGDYPWDVAWPTAVVTEDTLINLPFYSYGMNERVEGRKIGVRSYYDEREKNWNVQFLIEHGKADQRFSLATTRIGIEPNANQSMLLDQQFNINGSDVDVLETYYGAACPAGTVRKFQLEPIGDGFYNFIGIEILTDSVVAHFRIGAGDYYFGFHYPLKPTTDLTEGGGFTVGGVDADGNFVNATHILVGGYNNGGVVDTPVANAIGASVSIRQEEDATWSWNIQTADKDLDEYGDGTGTGSEYLFRYGTENDEMRWVGRYTVEDILAGGTVDLRGEYISLLWDATLEQWDEVAAGTANSISGRRMVIGILRNERIIDGVLFYDVYENVITADLEDDDDWYWMGVNEGADRKLKTMKSVLTKNDYMRTPATTGETEYTDIVDETNVFTLMENATKRRRTIKRERKYFVRRPKVVDLESAGIFSEMEAVADASGEPNVFSSRTIDVLKLGQNNFAVERVTITYDSETYADPDAITRYVDDIDDPAVYRQEIAIEEIEDLRL